MSMSWWRTCNWQSVLEGADTFRPWLFIRLLKFLRHQSHRKNGSQTRGAAQLLTCNPYKTKLVNVAEEKAKVMTERNDMKKAREDNKIKMARQNQEEVKRKNTDMLREKSKKATARKPFTL